MDDFDREVYCIAGLPFDAITMMQTMDRLHDAKLNNTTCFLTTPNLNFLALSQKDAEFRNSVIYSDLVIADGAPIVWMAKLLGIPIKERVAGSSLFAALGQEQHRKMSVYFFGGPDGVAAEANKWINEESKGLNCVGYFSPGFGTLDEMSASSVIDNINHSKADFLVVALGAKKGQAWILKNLNRIDVPLISHLGAVVNFEAKRLKRAPVVFQKLGFEWLWRIKEEPNLWRRYWYDGQALVKMAVTQILPHMIWLKFNTNRLAAAINSNYLLNDAEVLSINVDGAILDPIEPDLRAVFKQLASSSKNVEIDLSNTEYLSSGFFGLLLMLKKQLDKNKLQLKLVGIKPSMKKFLAWHGLTYLL
jgi:N-acetylglucosaminyldiphosphoundecaprenol N-acetyl-beta-D-mannosaminyltransferase